MKYVVQVLGVVLSVSIIVEILLQIFHPISLTLRNAGYIVSMLPVAQLLGLPLIRFINRRYLGAVVIARLDTFYRISWILFVLDIVYSLLQE